MTFYWLIFSWRLKHVNFEISTTDEPGIFEVSVNFKTKEIENVELVFQVSYAKSGEMSTDYIFFVFLGLAATSIWRQDNHEIIWSGQN